MRVVIAAFGVLGCVGCVRATEGAVRDQAAGDLACIPYALTIVEVGPEVFRASGCGQEVIYTCVQGRAADGEPAVSCARTPE